MAPYGWSASLSAIATAGINAGSGVPRRALLLNFVLGLAFLLPFRSWQSIVAATSELRLFAYSMSAISQSGFRKSRPDRVASWIKGMPVIAPGPSSSPC